MKKRMYTLEKKGIKIDKPEIVEDHSHGSHIYAQEVMRMDMSDQYGNYRTFEIERNLN